MSSSNEIGSGSSICSSPPFCRCGVRAELRTSFRPWSLGRRFYGCRYYDGDSEADSRDCRYFKWFDAGLEPFPKRAVELIYELKAAKEGKEKKIGELKKRLAATPERTVVEEYVGVYGSENGTALFEIKCEKVLKEFEQKCEKVVKDAVMDAVKKIAREVFYVTVFALVVAYYYRSTN